MMGVTQQGAGAAAASGRLLSTLRTYPAATGVAVAGLAVMGWALGQIVKDANRARRRQGAGRRGRSHRPHP